MRATLLLNLGYYIEVYEKCLTRFRQSQFELYYYVIRAYHTIPSDDANG